MVEKRQEPGEPVEPSQHPLDAPDRWSRRAWLKAGLTTTGIGALLALFHRVTGLTRAFKTVQGQSHEHDHGHLSPEVLDLKNEATIKAVKSGNFSDPAVWDAARVPGADDFVYIGPNLVVTYDLPDADLSEIFVDDHAQLKWSTGKDTSMKVNAIYINSQAGLTIGRDGEPITGQARILIKGTPKEQVVGGAQFERAAHGIWSWGRASICGQARSPWCRLVKTAQRGDKVIYVDANSLDWKPGEHLILARGGQGVGDTEMLRPYPADESELPDMRENEECVIDRVQGNAIYLTKPLRFKHLGEPQTRRQSEVAMIDRNITITSADPSVGRGHVVFFRGVRLRHARFDQLGINGRLGKYPVHCHIPSEIAEGWKELEGLVVTHSGFHGIVLHRCKTYRVKDCFVFNVMGFGYYVELTSDRSDPNVFANNEFQHCAGGLVKGFLSQAVADKMAGGEEVRRSDAARPLTSIGHDHPTVFWLSNPKQKLTDCSAWDSMRSYSVGYVDEHGVGDIAGGENGPTLFKSCSAHHCVEGVYSAYTKKFNSDLSVSVWACSRGIFDYGFVKRNEKYYNFYAVGCTSADIHIPVQGDELDNLVFENGYIADCPGYGGLVVESGPAVFRGTGITVKNTVFERNSVDVYFNTPPSNSKSRYMKARFENCTFRSDRAIRMDGGSETSWREETVFEFVDCTFTGKSSKWLNRWSKFKILPSHASPSLLPANAHVTNPSKSDEATLEGNIIVPL